MKKSFKRIVAVLLAVMMIVCSFPLTVLAADSNRTNINLQFGDVSNKSTAKNYSVDRRTTTSDFVKYSGLNSTKLEYSNGKITGYSTGEFFTVSVLVENVSKIAAAEVAIKYSDSITPAYIKDITSGTAVVEYTESGAALSNFQPLEAITDQSGDAIHNTTHTVGETSYIDADKKVIHAKYAVQTGDDYVDTSSVSVGKQSYTNTAVLATFMFKIVSDDAITFSIDTDDDNYYLETAANGGSVDEYKTYVPKTEGAEAELDFMGKNEYNGSTTKSYTITFNDEDGKVLQTGEYEEGTDVIAPALPAVTHDDEKHYTYSWDKEVVSPAAADATYTRVKTGAAHTWDDGVVTVEPTTTSTGIKTYTCTFDGCGATKTEELPKKEETHTHTWSDWTYNGDAEYTSSTVYKDGTATRKCTECGETETKTIAGTGLLRPRTLNADFGGEISATIAVRTETFNSFNDVYVEIGRSDGKTDIIYTKDFYKKPGSETNMWFKYGVTPQGLDSTFTITYYAYKDGIKCWGESYEYNMIDKYILPQLTNPKSTIEWKKLLVEMIYYGSEAQYYKPWNPENPSTNRLTEEQKALHSTEPLQLQSHKNNSYVVIDNPKAKWKSLNLNYGAGTELRFKVRDYTPNENTKVVVEVDGNVYTYYYSEDAEKALEKRNFEVTSDGGVWFTFRDLLTKYLRTPVHVTFYEGETQISNTYQWSAETYAYGVSSTKKDYAISQQLMRFANAAIDYFANK